MPDTVESRDGLVPCDVKTETLSRPKGMPAAFDTFLMRARNRQQEAENSPGLHHELRLDALPVELHTLADDVLVAALVPEVLAAQAVYELREAVAGHGVGHYGGPRVFSASMPAHRKFAITPLRIQRFPTACRQPGDHSS